MAVDLSKCVYSIEDVGKDYYFIFRYVNERVDYDIAFWRMTGYEMYTRALISNKINIYFKQRKLHVK